MKSGHKRRRHKLPKEHFLYCGDRVVNFRPVFFLSLSFGLGIFFCFLFGLRALYGALAFLPVLALGLLIRRKSLTREFLSYFLLVIVALSSFFVLGALSFSVRIGNFESQPIVEGDCLIFGEVEETAASQEYDCYTVGDLTLFCEDTGELFTTNYRIRVYVYRGGSTFSAGDLLSFSAEVETHDLWSYGRLNASAVLDRVRYRAFVSAEEIEKIGENGVDLFGTVNDHVREVLYAGMDDENASLAYAMLTGNSGFMDEDVLQNFRYGGVAHIFAVSGLHIGIVCALVSAILKRFRLPAYVRIPIVSAVLFFFSGICGFSPSSVRALVMCVVLMITGAAGTGLDRLTSVSFAALAVLIADPVYLFSVGFQLSLAAAAGIIVLGGHLTRQLGRIPHFPKRAASALGTAVSAQVCTFPILIDSFGYTSGIGLVLNLLFIPVISAVFSLLFLCTVLACVLPFAATWLLFVPKYFLSVAVLPILALDLKVLLLCGFSFGGCAAIWYLGIWLLTDKVNLKRWVKGVCSAVLCVIFVVCMLLRNLPIGVETLLTVHGYYGSGFVLLREEGKTSLFSFGELRAEHVEQVFLKEGIDHVDVFIPLGGAQAASSALPVLLQYCSVDCMYVGADWGYVHSFHTVEVKETNGVFAVGGAYADFIGEDALFLYADSTRFVLADDLPQEGVLPDCDLLVARSEEIASFCISNGQVFLERSEGNLSVHTYGDLQICRKNDIISVKEIT